jgi:hypothetical protein
LNAARARAFSPINSKPPVLAFLSKGSSREQQPQLVALEKPDNGNSVGGMIGKHRRWRRVSTAKHAAVIGGQESSPAIKPNGSAPANDQRRNSSPWRAR